MMAIDTSLPALEEQTSASPAISPPSSWDEISLLDILIVLLRSKGLILGVTLAFAVLSVVISLLLPKEYTATILLLPPQQNSSLSAQLASQLGSLGSMAALASGGGGSLLKNTNEMYVSMLKSRTVEDAVVDHFGLMQEYHMKYISDTRKRFERHASVDAGGKDGLIRISVADRDPRRAADLANGYVDQFRKLSETLAITEAGQRRLFFLQQMEHAKDDLANAEVALTRTEQKTGLIQLDSQARALIESAASLRAQITAKQVQIQGMETYATGENAQVIQARQELESMRSQLAQLGGNQDIPGSGILPAKGQMTEATMEYMRRLRDFKYYETIFDILARQFEMAKLDEAKEGALIQVVDTAVPPDKRSFPKRGLIVLGSTVAGFLLGILAALLRAGFTKLREDGEAASKLAVIRNLLSFRSNPTRH
jgi:tyrosine-protein kinase Etk/Wzc